MVQDQWKRPLGSLRISVTDRCNLRCHYCMPEETYTWLDKRLILDYDEIQRVARCFVEHGVDRIRLTGGEPLLRQDLHELVLRLRTLPIQEIALTTNGLLLPKLGASLIDAGLDRVTISLDSLDAAKYARLTGRDKLQEALAGIQHACELPFRSVKLNVVVVRGENDDELIDLLEFGRAHGCEVRFIEYMDVGGATLWQAGRVLSRDAMLMSIRKHYGDVTAVPKHDRAPADRWQLPDGTVFGIISSTTAPFCGSCDRSRLTADGTWYTCLYARTGLDLRALLRDGSDDAALREAIASTWQARRDRGAEDRVALRDRQALAGADELRDDPRLEMHTRGG